MFFEKPLPVAEATVFLRRQRWKRACIRPLTYIFGGKGADMANPN